jgi:hypothetical protein
MSLSSRSPSPGSVVGLIVAFFVLGLVVFIPAPRHGVSASKVEGILLRSDLRPFRVTGIDSRPENPQITVEDVASSVRYRIPWCEGLDGKVGQTVMLPLETWGERNGKPGSVDKVNAGSACAAGVIARPA